MDWMFGDCSTGPLAKLNPMRYSKEMTKHELLDDLRQYSNSNRMRPIVIRDNTVSGAPKCAYDHMFNAIEKLESELQPSPTAPVITTRVVPQEIIVTAPAVPTITMPTKEIIVAAPAVPTITMPTIAAIPQQTITQEVHDGKGVVQFLWTPDFLDDDENKNIAGQNTKIGKIHSGTIEWDLNGSVTGKLEHDKGTPCHFEGRWTVDLATHPTSRAQATFEVRTGIDAVLKQAYTLKGRLWTKADQDQVDLQITGADGVRRESFLKYVNGIINTEHREKKIYVQERTSMDEFKEGNSFFDNKRQKTHA